MFTFNPINIDAPPQHTQIQPRCETCSKKKVCSVILDYYKTAKLIQNILGDPQLDRQLVPDCGFVGFDFEEDIFPKQINVEPHKVGDPYLIGYYVNAKYTNKDKVKLLYKIEDFFVMFIFTWSNEFERYELTYNKEIYYGLIYDLPQETIDEITTPLINWRAEQIKKEEEQKKKDIINTTLFSVILNCSEYEYDKKKKECDEYGLHHIATYHQEDNPVPLYRTPASAPIAYPVFIPGAPPPKPPKPPRRRGDINDEN